MVEKELLLVVENDPEQRRTLEDVLRAWGYPAIGVSRGKEALERLAEGGFTLVLLDLTLPDAHGLDVLRELKGIDSGLDVILITAHATLDSAVEAVNAGAFAYAIKPLDLHHLQHLVWRALERRRLQREAHLRDREMRACAELQVKVFNERVHLLEESNRKQQQLARLYEAIAAAQQTLDFEETARRLLRSLLQEVGAQYADLVMLNRDGTTEKNVVQFLGVAPFALHRVPGGLVDTVITTCQPAYIPEMIPRPRANPDLIGAGMQSSFGLPLNIGSRVEGVLCFSSTRVRAFDGEIDFLEAIASTLAIALERAKLLERVQTAKHEWETAFDAIGEGVVIMDKDKTILRANKAFAKLVGLPVEQVIRQDVCRLVHGSEAPDHDCPLARASATGHSESFELREHLLSNKLLHVRAYPIPGQESRFVHLFREQGTAESDTGQARQVV